MRMDFLMSGHFFGASERGSGRHKVTLWRPEKMAEREKDAADAGNLAQPSKKNETRKILFHFFYVRVALAVRKIIKASAQTASLSRLSRVWGRRVLPFAGS